MIEIEGDIWNYKSPLTPICITTNGSVKTNGQCVMGRGVALQAKIRYPTLPKELGTAINIYGNVTLHFPKYNLITFPVQHFWMDTADIELIRNSSLRLLDLVKSFEKIYLIRPGCSNGKLQWEEVKPVIEKILISDNFIVVQNGN